MGRQRGEALLPREGLGVWGCPPILSSPPRLGEPEGVEKKLINNLIYILQKYLSDFTEQNTADCLAILQNRVLTEHLIFG
jgi:hypothetical protein